MSYEDDFEASSVESPTVGAKAAPAAKSAASPSVSPSRSSRSRSPSSGALSAGSVKSPPAMDISKTFGKVLQMSDLVTPQSKATSSTGQVCTVSEGG